MDQLIPTINQLQQLNNKYKLPELQLPQIVVIGSQSSGKSSVMERIIGHDILPKASKVATRCPIVLQLQHRDGDDNIVAIFSGDNHDFIGPERISGELQRQTTSIGQSREGVSRKPIIVQLFSSAHPTLTLIDLPGMIKNDGELPNGSTDKIQKLTEEYAALNHSIILAISAANVDLANSDAINVAKKYDPEGRRTINVITKLDLMDKGTSVSDILNSTLLEKSLRTICVVNRSQESVTNKLSIKTTNDDEIRFLQSKSDDIKGEHGVLVLISVLVGKLRDEISTNIPEMQDVINRRIDCIVKELKNCTIEDKNYIVTKTIATFIREYSNLIKGEKERYLDQLVGGTKISHILYTDFVKQINNITATKPNKTKILNLLKNTAGNKKMSYSIERTFVCLIRDEIERFQRPSLECNNSIKHFLVEFVLETIDELQLGKYVNLSGRIVKEMNMFIEKKFEDTNIVIKNIIRGEMQDVFCLRPNTIMFDTIGSNLKTKIEEVKKSLFNNIIESAAGMCTTVLPPNLKLLLLIANGTGALSILKDSIASFLQNTTEMPPPDLMDIIGKVAKNSGEKKEIVEFISKEKKLPELIDKISADAKRSEEDEEGECNPNIIVIEDMVVEYFKEVQNNVIRNVPKWIQLIFIDDLLHELEEALYPINREEDKDALLNLDPAEEEKIKSQKEELKELQGIADQLGKLRQRY